MVLLTFKAPNTPLSENESRRMHWAVRRRRLENWALLTSIAWRKADKEDKDTLVNQKIEIKVSLPFGRKSRRDAHNYIGTNIKTIIDALVKEGAMPDDTAEYITVLEPSLKIDKDYLVTILLRPIGKLEE